MNNQIRKVVLAVGAHPDDIEFGCGATMAKLAREGADIYFLVCTSGNRGSRQNQISVEELVDKRKEEAKSAAKVLGAKEVFFLDHEDGNLEANLNLKEEIVKIIRKIKPDMIFTHDPSWFYVSRGDFSFINHNDHRETGKAVLDAVYPLSRDLLSFPEHATEGLAPHKVEEVYLVTFSDALFAFDVSKSIDTKIAAIKEHKSQVDDPEEVEEWVKQWAKELGKKFNYSYAEGFIKLVLR